MILTTSDSHRFMIIRENYNIEIDLKNKLIFGKYPFNYAKNDNNILVVSDSVYKHIMIDIESRL